MSVPVEYRLRLKALEVIHLSGMIEAMLQAVRNVEGGEIPEESLEIERKVELLFQVARADAQRAR